MATEIERKFLVVGNGWKAAPRVRAIAQGYLAADPASVRIRIQDGAATLTIKGEAEGLVRDEFEYAVPLADAEAMLRLCPEPPIVKKRHEIVHAGKLWQVDAFEGALAGLVVAEVELERADEVITLPDWVGREVTWDRRYRNSSLIRHGLAGLSLDAAAPQRCTG
ncbi:CYTH domain-containing protein [Phreatobacter cathodiphilus]|uniref:Adenylate cyclase n=1 Tax=Phreatobacter cathodiphilus TaxID=1868589 RepID=A0A2S0ND91_9HYPH|nr:CYTH domain-containing protein [Phreatobacter cathodiphilus]AVO45901.1 adenylate cyclase [Phreatobacter cathodiphilus]